MVRHFSARRRSCDLFFAITSLLEAPRVKPRALLFYLRLLFIKEPFYPREQAPNSEKATDIPQHAFSLQVTHANTCTRFLWIILVQ